MTGPDHHAEMESHYATGRELSEALMRVAELEAENARLREEWAQEGIGWLRDKDIDRLMGVEDENKRLRERLEDMNGSLRVELAAKQGAHNEIRILDGALRSAVRRLDEGHDIKPESQAHGDMRDALT